ncbi:MAG: histidinol dehydrogenase [Rhodospirillales bacterium]|jgi:histidinol dehydrogenase|nr:histidinol dehydrogenase [Rhodospirillales bacterium]
MPVRLDTGEAGFDNALTALLAAKRETAADVDEAVRAILADVRMRGDAALIDHTARFDRLHLTPDTLRLSAQEIAAAVARCSREQIEALELAANRIASFHALQRPIDVDHVDPQGVRVGWRWTAVAAAGLYVPGGTAAYPSSVLMNALPARTAGVERLVMTVPAPGGAINPLVLAAAEICGVDEVYRVGGAQAIGALAYGTAAIAAVDKIVGPGNAYVAAAKRQVFGHVGIDTIAGPSEVLIVADGDTDPDWIAADLLAQAEHDAAAQSILVTDDPVFAGRVAAAVDAQLLTLSRSEIAAASWTAHGAIIVVANWDEAADIIDRVAPEHLQLALDDQTAETLVAQVRNAGAIFLGRLAPEALGDYIAGPNHVLPTARSARFASGLGVLDFMKRTTFIGCGSEGLAAIGPAAVMLAEAEGLEAHARSVALRLNRRR